MAQSSGLLEKKSSKLSKESIPGIVLLVLVCVLFYYPMHAILENQVQHPAVIVLMPFVGMAWIAFVIPLFMFISYPEDYKRLNPFNPVHYFYIAKKSYRAMSQNNYKVSVKDL